MHRRPDLRSRPLQAQLPAGNLLCLLLPLTLLFTGTAVSCQAPDRETYDESIDATRLRRLYVSSGQELDSDRSLPPVPAAPAAPAPGEDSLRAYQGYALAASRPLRRAFAEWLASDEEIAVAGTLPNPRLGWTEFLREVETRTGPQARRLGVAQRIPWAGKRQALSDAAAGAATVAWHRVEAQALATREQVTVAYHDWALLGTELALAGEQLELLRQLEPVVQSRILAGGRQEDLLRLQVEIARLENEVSSLADRDSVLRARLAAAMSLPDAGLLVRPELRAPLPGQLDTALLVQSALEANPELAQAMAELGRATARLESAELSRMPDVTVGVDYFVTENGMAGVEGRGEDPVAVSLGIDLPLWRSSYDAAERAARHRVQAARLDLDRRQELLVAEIEAAVYRLDDSARSMVLFRDTLLPRVGEQLELTLASYRSGGATLLDLIDTEQQQLAFERSYWRACRDWLETRAHLDTLVGEIDR